ncbi:11531_t:CDS:2, partial [Gigaspora margarita]
ISDQQLTSGELLKDKYYKLLQDTKDITQIEELMNKLEQSTKTIKELTKSNNAFKIVLQITKDECNFYKSSNFEEFNKFIENYIVNLFDNFNFNN